MSYVNSPSARKVLGAQNIDPYRGNIQATRTAWQAAKRKREREAAAFLGEAADWYELRLAFRVMVAEDIRPLCCDVGPKRVELDGARVDVWCETCGRHTEAFDRGGVLPKHVHGWAVNS